MKQISNPHLEDDLRAEYDFSKLRVVARGPARRSPAQRTVELAQDVAQVFTDADSVNEALRLLIKTAQLSAVKK